MKQSFESDLFIDKVIINHENIRLLAMRKLISIYLPVFIFIIILFIYIIPTKEGSTLFERKNYEIYKKIMINRDFDQIQIYAICKPTFERPTEHVREEYKIEELGGNTVELCNILAQNDLLTTQWFEQIEELGGNTVELCNFLAQKDLLTTQRFEQFENYRFQKFIYEYRDVQELCLNYLVNKMSDNMMLEINPVWCNIKVKTKWYHYLLISCTRDKQQTHSETIENNNSLTNIDLDSTQIQDQIDILITQLSNEEKSPQASISLIEIGSTAVPELCSSLDSIDNSVDTEDDAGLLFAVVHTLGMISKEYPQSMAGSIPCLLKKATKLSNSKAKLLIVKGIETFCGPSCVQYAMSLLKSEITSPPQEYELYQETIRAVFYIIAVADSSNINPLIDNILSSYNSSQGARIKGLHMLQLAYIAPYSQRVEEILKEELATQTDSELSEYIQDAIDIIDE